MCEFLVPIINYLSIWYIKQIHNFKKIYFFMKNSFQLEEKDSQYGSSDETLIRIDVICLI